MTVTNISELIDRCYKLAKADPDRYEYWRWHAYKLEYLFWFEGFVEAGVYYPNKIN